MLKGVISLDDWDNIKEHIQYDFLKDGHFTELKETELLNDRINTLQSIEAYVGSYFSKEYVMKSVLRLNDSEIEDMKKQISDEAKEEPESDEEIKRYEGALRRRQLSLVLAGKMEAKNATELMSIFK